MNAVSVRRLRAAATRAALCLAALATLGFPGCPDGVTRPGGGNPYTLTMSNCWPNDDHREWVFAVASRPLQGDEPAYLPPGSEVPAVSLAEARAMLAQPVAVLPDLISHYDFGLRFDGMMTTYSGVVAQRLVESYDGAPVGSAAARPFADRFLALLAEARPDLRGRLALPATSRGASVAAEPPRRLPGPNLVHGYAWSKRPAWIGTFGDIDTLLAWKFLEADIQPGHAFRHQLVPSLASDVWLHARVERRLAVSVPGGMTVANAIEVLYLLDYGVAEVTDMRGEVLGLRRTFDYGTVTYAPGVGPVRSLERRFAYRGANTTLGVLELDLALRTTGVNPPGLLAGARRGP